MRITTAACRKCAAPLEIREDVKYLTCQLCSSSLQVVRDGDAILTQLCERAEQLEDEVAELKKQLELQSLEREWAEECERHAVYSDSGRALPERDRPHYGMMIAYAAGGVTVLFGVMMLLSRPADVDEVVIPPTDVVFGRVRRRVNGVKLVVANRPTRSNDECLRGGFKIR